MQMRNGGTSVVGRCPTRDQVSPPPDPSWTNQVQRPVLLLRAGRRTRASRLAQSTVIIGTRRRRGRIDTDILDDSEYILHLSHGERFAVWTVNVSGLSQQELAKVGKGDKVTVVGEFDDGGDLGVELKNGRLA